MKKTTLAIAVSSLLFSGNMFAADINFNGYGSVRAGLVLDDEHMPQSHSYDDEISFKEESLFALQAQSQFNEDWSATIVLQARGDNDFDVEARWAYLNYQVTSDTTLTFGRFALPYFRHSDTQDIGYSHNYSRMPKSIYEGQEFDIIEGIRVVHTRFVGDGDLTFKGSYGAFSGSAATSLGEVDTDIDNILQASLEYNYEWFSAFVGVVSAEVNLDINDQLDGQLMMSLPGYTVNNGVAYNPANIAVYQMEDMYVDEDSSFYWSTGFTIDHLNWIFNAEYAAYDVDDSFFEESQAYFMSLGYRYDRIVASLVYQKSKFDFSYEHANSQDPFMNGYANAVSNAFFKPSENDAQGIHIRYDASSGIAYKFEYTYVHDELPDESAGVVTLGVDFVF